MVRLGQKLKHVIGVKGRGREKRKAFLYEQVTRALVQKFSRLVMVKCIELLNESGEKRMRVVVIGGQCLNKVGKVS